MFSEKTLRDATEYFVFTIECITGKNGSHSKRSIAEGQDDFVAFVENTINEFKFSDGTSVIEHPTITFDGRCAMTVPFFSHDNLEIATISFIKFKASEMGHYAKQLTEEEQNDLVKLMAEKNWG